MSFKFTVLMIMTGFLLFSGIRGESRLYDSVANEAQLKKKFDSYITDLAKLRSQVTSLKQQINKAKGDSSLGISALQETMANERDTLFNIQSYLTLPFNYSLCDCYTFTNEQKARLSGHLNTLKQSIETLQKNAALETKCKLMEDVKAEAIRQLGYVDGLDKILKADCCGKRTTTAGSENASGMTNLANNQYQTNMKAKNWIYDGMSSSELRLRYFSRSASRNVINCPIETPFASGGVCIDCTGNTPLWSMRLERCLGCPQGSTFNESTKTCWRTETSEKTSETQQVVEPDKEEIEVLEPVKSKVIKTKTVTTSKKGEKIEESVVEPHETKKVKRTVVVNGGSSTSRATGTREVEEEVDAIVSSKKKRTVTTTTQASSGSSGSTSSSSSTSSTSSSASGSTTEDEIVEPVRSAKITRSTRHMKQSL